MVWLLVLRVPYILNKLAGLLARLLPMQNEVAAYAVSFTEQQLQCVQWLHCLMPVNSIGCEDIDKYCESTVTYSWRVLSKVSMYVERQLKQSEVRYTVRTVCMCSHSLHMMKVNIARNMFTFLKKGLPR
jgi:hypothetical protein